MRKITTSRKMKKVRTRIRILLMTAIKCDRKEFLRKGVRKQMYAIK